MKQIKAIAVAFAAVAAAGIVLFVQGWSMACKAMKPAVKKSAS